MLGSPRPAGLAGAAAELGGDQRPQRATDRQLVAAFGAGALLSPAIPRILADQASERWVLFDDQLEHGQQMRLGALTLRQRTQQASLAFGQDPRIVLVGPFKIIHQQPSLWPQQLL